jgi:hypothetical protein
LVFWGSAGTNLTFNTNLVVNLPDIITIYPGESYVQIPIYSGMWAPIPYILNGNKYYTEENLIKTSSYASGSTTTYYKVSI